LSGRKQRSLLSTKFANELWNRLIAEKRIGRLKAKYPSIHKHYETRYHIDIQENKPKTKKQQGK
jgi:hypothetical protein